MWHDWSEKVFGQLEPRWKFKTENIALEFTIVAVFKPREPSDLPADTCRELSPCGPLLCRPVLLTEKSLVFKSMFFNNPLTFAYYDKIDF